MALNINIYGSKVLRKKALPVTKVTKEMARLADEMVETMYESSGIGLAAPQVGHSIRLIVVDLASEDETDDDEDAPRNALHIFNPVVVKKEGLCAAEEGCLSIPGVWADVERPETITVRGMDKHGKPLELKDISGILARCIQHEIDHLDGVLFVDKISSTDRTLNESKLKKLSKEAKSVTA